MCATCLSGAETETNQIVQCSLCKKWSHQYCNGPILIPKGNWFCGSCKPYEFLRRKYHLLGVLTKQIAVQELKHGGVGKFFSQMEQLQNENKKLVKKNKTLKLRVNKVMSNIKEIIVEDSDTEDENSPVAFDL